MNLCEGIDSMAALLTSGCLQRSSAGRRTSLVDYRSFHFSFCRSTSK